MATIASLAVQLSLNAESAMSGFDRVGKTVKNFGQTVNSTLGGVQGMFKALVGALSSIPVIGGFFAAIPLTLKSFISTVKEGINEMLDMSKAAKRLGISVEALAAIQYAAGGSTEGMERGLFKMQAQLGAAAAGSKEAQDKFGKLGLNWQELSKLPLDQSFAKVNDRLQELGNTAGAKYAAFSLFGKTGFEIVGKSARLTTAALEAARKKVAELGATFSDADVGSLARAKKAFKDLDLIMTNIKRNLAIEFAPVLGGIAEAFGLWVKQAGGLREAFHQIAMVVRNVLADILEAVAEIVTSIKDLKGQMQQVGGGIEANLQQTPGAMAGNFILNASRTMAQWMQQHGLMQQVQESVQARQAQRPSGLQGLVNSLRDPQAYTLPAAKKADGLSELNQALFETNKKGAELLVQLGDEVEAFGRSSKAVELNKLMREGLDKTIAKGIALRIQELEDLQKAKTIYEQTATPLEKFTDRLDELKGLLDRGKLDWETYSRAVALAGDELERAAKLAEAKFGPALIEGSQEAYKVILAAQQPQPQNPVESLRDAILSLQEAQAKQADDVQDIARAVTAWRVKAG